MLTGGNLQLLSWMDLLPPLTCIFTQSGGVSLLQFITFVLILLEACVTLITQLSACINQAAASAQDISLALA